MMTKEGPPKWYIFCPPPPAAVLLLTRAHISPIVKISLTIFFSTPEIGLTTYLYIVIVTKDGFTDVVNFLNPPPPPPPPPPPASPVVWCGGGGGVK